MKCGGCINKVEDFFDYFVSELSVLLDLIDDFWFEMCICVWRANPDIQICGIAR